MGYNHFKNLSVDSDTDMEYDDNINNDNIVSNNNSNNSNCLSFDTLNDTSFQKYTKRSKGSKPNRVNNNNNNNNNKNNNNNNNNKNNRYNSKYNKNIKHIDTSTMNIPIENFNNNMLDNNMPMELTALAHHNDDKNWNFTSFHPITVLKVWKDIGKFFNTLNNTREGECSMENFEICLMKNMISPIWEDPENRNGSICTIMINNLDEAYSLFKKIAVYMANRALLKYNNDTWDVVNGISYTTKKINGINMSCVIIKIWFKLPLLNTNIIDKLLVDDISSAISKYSVRVKLIKPEY